MKKYTFLLIVLNYSCTNISNAYMVYKKTLGLDERGSYLLVNNKHDFVNSDVNVDYQVFDEVSDEFLNKEEVLPLKVDESFINNLALFEKERSSFQNDFSRVPASVETNYDLYLKAQSLIKKGAFDKAEKLLKNYVFENPLGAHAYSSYLNLAELKIHKKKYIEALSCYTEIFINKYESTDYELLYSKLHYLYLKLGKKELALNYKKKLETQYSDSNYLKTIK